MYRLQGAMERASRRHLLIYLVLVSIFALSTAGPLGPLPNVTVTSANLGLKEEGCAVGDVVYLPGDDVPGTSACERCRCAGGRVSCARAVCEPRPGCKALHRPDHCCPTYQCECEQEGRVYGNGEKLVDPGDPCRVCYCQGGEVVCRRIACFRRDDCVPRAVPGRCCPEYDNCPLRGVTALPGAPPSMSSAEETSSPAPAPPSPPRESIKQEITIKEITPVSEIPILPDIKIKEVLPTQGFEVPDYSSSKSPVIVREATSERAIIVTPINGTTDSHVSDDTVNTAEDHSSQSQTPLSSQAPSHPGTPFEQTEATNDPPPSKISLSTQGLINVVSYPAIQTSIATMEGPVSTAELLVEEDPPSFDHNPAFPPIPDDLSVVGNHEDDLMMEQLDSDHGLHEHTDRATTSHETIATSPTPLDVFTVVEDNSVVKVSPAVQVTDISTHSDVTNDFSSNNVILSSSPTTAADESAMKLGSSPSLDASETTKIKDSPMLNLRSAIPTDILDMPSSVPEEITGELDEPIESSAAVTDTSTILTSVATEKAIIIQEKFTEQPELPKETIASTTTTSTAAPTTPEAKIEISSIQNSTPASFPVQTPREQTPGPESKSGIVTEITAQTEFSSLPIETSDQNPRENLERIEKEKSLTSTAEPVPTVFASTKASIPVDSEVITVSSSDATSIENNSPENFETTEFVITSFGSSESVTDNVELIKISAEPNKNAAIIDTDSSKKNSVLTDLIKLVGDVASIGDHTDPPAPPVISESEELIPVNAGYKSKNNNWNQNSITEVPMKTKTGPTGTKQKVVEIEDDEAGITDAVAPHDRVEPTTRRPTIDNVDDTKQSNKTDKKDIEIITKSYVPTIINRRPTKVVMKKSNEKPVIDDSETAVTSGAVSASIENTNTDSTASGGTPSPAPAHAAETTPASAAASEASSTASPTATETSSASAVTSAAPSDGPLTTTTLNL